MKYHEWEKLERDLNRIDKLFLMGMIVFLSLATITVIIGIVEIVKTQALERECLSYGYPRADWRWIGPDYCIKRLEQTDIVVEISYLRGKQ